MGSPPRRPAPPPRRGSRPMTTNSTTTNSTTAETLDPAGYAIERTLDFASPPARVWAALTRPAELSAWFGTATELDPATGSVGRFVFGDDAFAVRIEAFEPERRLVWRWAGDAGVRLDVGPTSIVEWRLEPSPAGGTRVVLRETGLRTMRTLEENTEGWFEEIGELREHLAVEPWERPIRRRLELKASRDRVWRALSEDDELRQWWGSTTPVDVRPGWEGWFS